MHKIILTLAAVAVFGFFAGCGDSGTSSSQANITESNAEAEAQKIVAEAEKL